MADGPNLFYVTESTINPIKKPQTLKKIMELKDKVAVESLYSYEGINGYSKSTFIQK